MIEVMESALQKAAGEGMDEFIQVFTDKYKDGTGPVYMDCSEIDKADMDYMTKSF